MAVEHWNRLAAQCRLCPVHFFMKGDQATGPCRDRFETVRGVAQHLSRVHGLRIDWKQLRRGKNAAS